MYFIVSNVEAVEKTVRVLDIDTGEYKDIVVSDLISLIKDGVLTMENAKVVNDELCMINGGLERYGLVTYLENGEVSIDPVAVVVGVIKKNGVLQGYRLANSDGVMYDYTVADAQNIFEKYTLANAEAVADKDGVYGLKQCDKPYPIIEIGGNTLELDDGNEEVPEVPERETIANNDIKLDKADTTIVKVDNDEDNRDISIPEEIKNSAGSSEDDITEKDTEEEPKAVDTNIKVEDVPAFEADETSEPKVEASNPVVEVEEATVFKPIVATKEGEEVAPVTDDLEVLKDSDKWVFKLTDGTELRGDTDILIELGILGVCEDGVVSGDNTEATDNIVEVTVPESVTCIAKGVFTGLKNLKTVTLPSTFKKVAVEAFAECTSLEKVNGTIEYIDDAAFYNCKALTEIDLSEAVYIGKAAFMFAGVLGDSVSLNAITSLGTTAFSHSGVTAVMLGDKLANIGSLVFSNCACLEEIVIKNKDNFKEVCDNGRADFDKWVETKTDEDVENIPCAGMFYKCSKLGLINLDDEVITKNKQYLFKESGVR